MNPIPERIRDFISENNVLTIATILQNIPYCATVFYAYIPEKNLLVFMSDVNTKHIQDTILNNKIAGTIITKNVSISNVRGIQFTGTIYELKEGLLSECKFQYLEHFPLAALHNSILWGIDISFLKLTDNRLGFGKKIIWNKS